jgi:hypothetical protein
MGADSTLTLDIDFATNGSFLDRVSSSSALVTFTRASTATYFESSGVLSSAAIDAARFDYNPSTLAARGLLLEEARTNVVLWNRDLTNAAWTSTNVTAAKTQTGIDGVANSASSITATAGNGTCLQAITLASSARFQTAYVKRLVGSGVVNMTTDNGATWTAVTVTAGWTRVSIPTQTLANPTVGFRLVTSGDSIAVDFVQNENGAFETSAIPVTTVAVTRAVDTAVMTGANFSSWYNQTQGTFVLDAEVTSTAVDGHLLNANNNTANERIIVGVNISTLTNSMAVVDSALQVSTNTANSISVNTPFKVAMAPKLNDFAIVLNGGTVATDTSGTMPTPDRLFIGDGVGAGEECTGWYRRLRYYNTRKANADLQTLTT